MPVNRPLRCRWSAKRRCGRSGPTAWRVAIVILVLRAGRVFAPLLAPYPPTHATSAVTRRPAAAHWLGTTQTGQDVFAQLLLRRPGLAASSAFAAGLALDGLAVAFGIFGGLHGRASSTRLINLFINVLLVIPACR